MQGVRIGMIGAAFAVSESILGKQHGQKKIEQLSEVELLGDDFFLDQVKGFEGFG